MTDTALKVNGIKQIVEVLTTLGPEVSKKIAITAMRKAMAPAAEAANVPIKSGSLYFAIHTRVATADKFDTRRVRAVLSSMTGGGLTGETAAIGSVLPIRNDAKAIAAFDSYYRGRRQAKGIRHGHFVEFGRRGNYSKHPFLLPALEGNAQQIVTTLETELRAGIERTLSARPK